MDFREIDKALRYLKAVAVFITNHEVHEVHEGEIVKGIYFKYFQIQKLCTLYVLHDLKNNLHYPFKHSEGFTLVFVGAYCNAEYTQIRFPVGNDFFFSHIIGKKIIR